MIFNRFLSVWGGAAGIFDSPCVISTEFDFCRLTARKLPSLQLLRCKSYPDAITCPERAYLLRQLVDVVSPRSGADNTPYDYACANDYPHSSLL